MYTINDIQIFIITHNRADMIKDSIESILNQTANVKELTVLDNESTDSTEEVVKSYADRGVKYIKTYGFLGNFNKAKEIADKEFVMLFHDDDILHPDYLRNALNLINKEKNVSAVYTRYKHFFDNDVPQNFPKLRKLYQLYKTQKDFAEYMFFHEHLAYASAIYKTEYFKQTELEYEKYNKFNDWPFMLKFAKYGNIILFFDEHAYYPRVHTGNDSYTFDNVPTLEQIVNWDKAFYDALFEKEDELLKKIYHIKSCYFLEGKYKTFTKFVNKSDYSLENLHELAQNKGLDICTNIYNNINNLPLIFSPKLIIDRYCKNLRFKNLHNRSFKQVKQSIKHCGIFGIMAMVENIAIKMRKEPKLEK